MGRKGSSFLAVLMLVGAAVLIGVALQGGAQIGYGQGPVASPTAQVAPTLQARAPVSSETELFRNIYQRSNPSVVSIRVRIPTQNLPINSDSGPGPDNNQPFQIAAGSGFVIDTQGHIVTNAHVVQGSDMVEVTFSDGKMMRAKISGIDLDSDLAIIQVEGDIAKYNPLPLGDSDAVQVGDLAFAIGNPFEQAGTMTHGIISALNRTVTGLHSSQSSSFSIPGAIQTDTPVNPGNSGGPLLNEFGQVIGINEQIEAPAGQSSGVSFAIPINLLKQFGPTLIQNGKVSHPYLGIGSVSLTLDINSALKLPDDQRGALVVSVAPNSPAAQANLQAAPLSADSSQLGNGDIITAVDNHPVQSSDDLIGYLFTKTSAGQTITLTLLRNGKQQSVKATLAARPEG